MFFMYPYFYSKYTSSTDVANENNSAYRLAYGRDKYVCICNGDTCLTLTYLYEHVFHKRIYVTPMHLHSTNAVVVDA